MMKQQFRRPIKVKSQSPFKIEWEVKHADPFIQNLKLRNEQLQLAPLVAPTNEDCWINCSLTSQSSSKVLYLTRASLDIIEKAKVKLLQKVDLASPSSVDDETSDWIRLDPGESYSCLFKTKADARNLDNEEELPELDLVAVSKTIREVEHFSELTFAWLSLPASSTLPYS